MKGDNLDVHQQTTVVRKYSAIWFFRKYSALGIPYGVPWSHISYSAIKVFKNCTSLWWCPSLYKDVKAGYWMLKLKDEWKLSGTNAIELLRASSLVKIRPTGTAYFKVTPVKVNATSCAHANQHDLLTRFYLQGTVEWGCWRERQRKNWVDNAKEWKGRKIDSMPCLDQHRKKTSEVLTAGTLGQTDGTNKNKQTKNEW